ncbi:hypothetical protein EJD97_020914 [Solanum chilense]|uniref:Uncharacterized protein n=1 Tax=Solanum chilense TaxID=4083 RepID=A0A6N2CCR7_SOLCI|nr:hypothetical protein EJD97_020914 [Solanum chilense]
MMTQDNPEVVPRANQHVGTMDSHLRDFTRMNPPTFYGSKVDEDSQKDKMRSLVTGVSDDLQEECHSTMLHGNINISHLMVHAQQLEETRAKRRSKDTKRERSFDGGSSKGRLDIQDKPRFKKRSSNQVPSKLPKARDDRASNPKSQKERGTISPNKKPTCGKCG